MRPPQIAQLAALGHNVQLEHLSPERSSEQFVVDRGDTRWTTFEYQHVRAIVGDEIVLDTAA